MKTFIFTLFCVFTISIVTAQNVVPSVAGDNTAFCGTTAILIVLLSANTCKGKNFLMQLLGHVVTMFQFLLFVSA